MLIPARRGHARAVATAIGEPRTGPGNPGGLDFAAFELAQQGSVTLISFQCGFGQHRRVPGTTNDRDPLKSLALSGANGLTHVGLALAFALILWCTIGAQSAHGLQNTLEKIVQITPLLNLTLPPQFIIVVPGSAGQQVQWLLFMRLLRVLLVPGFRRCRARKTGLS